VVLTPRPDPPPPPPPSPSLASQLALRWHLRRRHQDRRPLRHHEVPRRAGARGQRRARHRRQAARAHQGAVPHLILRRLLPGLPARPPARPACLRLRFPFQID
jgi:hypothetical protein